MTTSILNDILLLKNSPLEKIQDYLKAINLTVFDRIIQKYEPQEAVQIILFIACGYSEDSPLIILRQDHNEEKDGICEYLAIPEVFRNNMIRLVDPYIRTAVTQYVTQFAGPLFRSYMFMKIQLMDFDLDITNRNFSEKKVEKGKEDEPDVVTYFYDIKEHGKAIAEHSRLSKQIDLLEKQIRAQVKKMEGIEDIKEFLHKEKDAGRIKGGRVGNIETTIK